MSSNIDVHDVVIFMFLITFHNRYLAFTSILGDVAVILSIGTVMVVAVMDLHGKPISTSISNASAVNWCVVYVCIFYMVI